MRALGRHVVIDLYGCDPDRLADVRGVERAMTRAARAAGAEVVKTVFHAFSPVGVSGVVVITESHLAVHTWPEHGYASVDLFTCGGRADPAAALAVLARAFRARAHTFAARQRGPLAPDGRLIDASKPRHPSTRAPTRS
jgi:S-adenosylmethionine decarboxylase proenzyme